MPITSQAVVRTDDDPDLLARLREEASGLAFPRHRPLHRPPAVQDAGRP
ncbi:hypothetical protein [Microvirga massiliensis]|nr:hypothetical protein [Microvirga massiliensis]